MVDPPRTPELSSPHSSIYGHLLCSYLTHFSSLPGTTAEDKTVDGMRRARFLETHTHTLMHTQTGWCHWLQWRHVWRKGTRSPHQMFIHPQKDISYSHPRTHMFTGLFTHILFNVSSCQLARPYSFVMVNYIYEKIKSLDKNVWEARCLDPNLIHAKQSSVQIYHIYISKLCASLALIDSSVKIKFPVKLRLLSKRCFFSEALELQS